MFNVLQRSQDQINNYGILKKITKIRHKVSAHRDRERSPQEIARELRPTFKDLKEVVALVRDVVSTLVQALGGETKSEILDKFDRCKASVADSVFQVVEMLSEDQPTLKKLHEL